MNPNTPLKLLAYLLLAIGAICGLAGIYLLIGRFLHDADHSLALALLLLLLGLLNTLGFKLLQRAFRP